MIRNKGLQTKFLIFFSGIFFSTIVLTSSVCAQQSISGTIPNYGNQKVYLFSTRADLQIPIDSATTNFDGSFSLFKPLSTGLYQLKTLSGNALDLVYEARPIQFVASDVSFSKPVAFIQSAQNAAWQEYKNLRNYTYRQEELLKPLLQHYDSTAPFYGSVKSEFRRLQNSLRSKSKQLIEENSGSFVSRLIKTDLRPEIELELSFAEQREHIIQRFFEQTDFSDTLLIQSNVLSSKLIDYLSLYQRPEQDMNQTQFAFIKGVDEILRLASVDNKMYAFVLEYLLEGFQHLGLSAVTDYLSALPHFNSGCIDTETLVQIERIVNPFRKIVIGASANPIEGTAINGVPFVLDTISNPHTIVVFWSLTCPHCLDLMPKLLDFRRENPSFAIVSVILSPESDALKAYIQDEALDWTHYVEGEGWQGPQVLAYHVYGTPTLFVLDKDKKIEAKPSGIEELRAFANSFK